MDRAIPTGAPRDPDLSIEDMAKNFDIAGNIISAAINGCIITFLTRREPVAMRHIVEGIARELVKMGKQVSPVHFGKYYEFVRGL